jgi:hypothetical protein
VDPLWPVESPYGYGAHSPCVYVDPEGRCVSFKRAWGARNRSSVRTELCLNWKWVPLPLLCRGIWLPCWDGLFRANIAPEDQMGFLPLPGGDIGVGTVCSSMCGPEPKCLAICILVAASIGAWIMSCRKGNGFSCVEVLVECDVPKHIGCCRGYG